MTDPFSKLLAQAKLQTILIVPFVLQIVGTVGLVGYLSLRNGQNAVNEMAIELQQETNARIGQNLDSYLALPVQIVKDDVAAFELGILRISDFKQMGQYFHRQLKIFQVGYINLATARGEYIGAGYYGTPEIKIEEIPLDTQGHSYIYSTDAQGNRIRMLERLPYNPREEDWYGDPVRAGQPVWSQIYNWEAYSNILSISYSHPIYDREKKLVAVMGVDLILSQISEFLRQLKIGRTGKAFIMERSGLMVASSIDEPPFVMADREARRLNVLKSRDPAIQSISQHLYERFGQLRQLKSPYSTILEIDRQKHYVQVSPWRDRYGLDWLVVVAVPEADFMGQINANTRTTILLSIAALILSIVLGILTARWITRPILRVNEAAKQIAAGKLEQTIQLNRTDELGELADSFNQMAEQLQNSFNALEQRVAERTTSLTQAIQKLEMAQTELIQSEKLAALGQLVAGIAHEINSPLGAIQSSSGNLSHFLEQVLEELPPLAIALPPEHLQNFLTLLNWARQSKEMLSSREERQLKRDLKQQLETLGIDRVDLLANHLSKMGIAHSLEPILPLLRSSNAPDIVETAYHLSIVQTSSRNIQIAVERAARIVYALKNYVRHDVTETLVKANVTDSIETVLTLYHNQIKPGIEVIRNYASIPLIWCYPEELTQVWTNLIHNAMQAMNYRGQLKIAISADEQYVSVGIEDTGNGIPLELQEKIFEPFFTTKPLGEGSGLGLSIVRKIVDKHQGRIEIASEPGHTIFKVVLPIDRPL